MKSNEQTLTSSNDSDNSVDIETLRSVIKILCPLPAKARTQELVIFPVPIKPIFMLIFLYFI